MEATTFTAITVSGTVNVSADKAWEIWTNPEHVKNWNSASPDWHTPKAENDLREGGAFSFTMAAKDGSFSFDFGGVYDEVKPHELIRYTLGDGRKVTVRFSANGNATDIEETFDAEQTNPLEMQQAGWQAILDNFIRYARAQHEPA
ncbi:MAG: polyketide cyclase [Sphingobacteriales bacterium]|nr:MAG: polyketide cyclase [Sphingobacteriales bacterium]